MLKLPQIKLLTNPSLLKKAAALPIQGLLAIASNNLVYLKIDDNYIHQLFPLLKISTATRPNYFVYNGIGAHISVIYPEEKIPAVLEEIGQNYTFTIQELVSAEFEHKIYYVLLVDAPELQQLRSKYHLADHLNFKGYQLTFHITIAKSA